jgi:hypothetical protein
MIFPYQLAHSNYIDVLEIRFSFRHSFGAIAALLQEIISIYPLLTPPRLTPGISNRCCNALALLQCVASHQDTRGLFLNCKNSCCLITQTPRCTLFTIFFLLHFFIYFIFNFLFFFYFFLIKNFFL